MRWWGGGGGDMYVSFPRTVNHNIIFLVNFFQTRLLREGFRAPHGYNSRNLLRRTLKSRWWLPVLAIILIQLKFVYIITINVKQRLIKSKVKTNFISIFSAPVNKNIWVNKTLSY